MKRFTAACLSFLLIFSLTGCKASQVQYSSKSITSAVGVLVICVVLILLAVGIDGVRDWIRVSKDYRAYVEQSCRVRKQTYLKYKDKLEHPTYKDPVILREYEQLANETAKFYNSFIRENSYVWKGKIPDDLPLRLHPLKFEIPEEKHENKIR